MNKEQIIELILKKEVVEGLLNLYNQKSRQKRRSKMSESIIYRIAAAICRAGGCIENIEKYINEYASESTDLRSFFAAYKKGEWGHGINLAKEFAKVGGICNHYDITEKRRSPKQKSPKKIEEVETETETELEEFEELTETEASNDIDEDKKESKPQIDLDALKKSISESVSEEVMENVEKAISMVSKRVAAEIKEQITSAPKEVKIINGDDVKISEKVYHSKFETILNYIQNGVNVFMTGPAGCGKNILAEQVAETLGIGFQYMGPVTSVYDLLGYQDANGVYHDTPCSLAVKNGDLFFKDEFDNDNPEAVVALNALLANGYINYPGIGFIKAHPNFRVIAAGNTLGKGADYDYVARNQLDAATLDRFAMITVDYDKPIELALTGNNLELVNFVHFFREATKNFDIHCLASYRCMQRISKLEALIGKIESISLESLMNENLLKGMDKDSLQSVIDYCNQYSNSTSEVAENKYYKAIVSICEEME